MTLLPLVVASLLGADPIRFQRHVIDAFPAGYQVAVADINGDGRLDLVVTAGRRNQLVWYENLTGKPPPTPGDVKGRP